VYSTVPVDGVGGLARVATIKKKLAAAGAHPLLMLGGDFLSSSVASTVFKGAQMIAALNATGLDVATLGNHEFDFGVETLLTRMAEAKFDWVVSNVVDRQTKAMVGGAPPYLIKTIGALKIGILGLCINSEGILPAMRDRLEITSPVDAVAKYLPELKREGADVIIALTHLKIGEDRELALRFPDIDVIVGGHEHYPITSVAGRTLISKAGMNARFVARIDLNKRGADPVDRYFELMPVTSAINGDIATTLVVNEWESKLDVAMDDTVATSTVVLDARNATLRLGESNLGDLVTDLMRAHTGADIALLNSGGIRGNRAYPPGPISRRTLFSMHPFNNVICKVEVSGRVLLQALESGVSQWPDPTYGRFPQVSGMTMRVVTSAAPGARVRDVTVNGAPIDLNRLYTVALPDFVLDGGDGYQMFADSRVLIDKEAGTPINEALEELLAGRTVAPQLDGRIRVER
ncbi:MAG: bifunctional UDP-sugar hydrolase/5'-nucleotidase, partial [Vicinamibacterales bacterium]